MGFDGGKMAKMGGGVHESISCVGDSVTYIKQIISFMRQLGITSIT